MGKVMIVDSTKCNGCYNCQLSCKDEHCGTDWSPIAKPQPDTGHFWYKITEVVQGTVPKVRVRFRHMLCQHCDDAPCMKACNNNAIYKREDGIVIIDPEKCRGAHNCETACPYGVIYFNKDLNIAQKCTFCAHLLDDGWTETRCSQSCPTDALIFGEEEDLKDLIAKAEILNPEANTSPRVYYIDPPNKFFIAGEVFDPAADECLEGVKVTLAEAGKKTTIETDVFGDFWFERRSAGAYSLKYEKPGYVTLDSGEFDVTKDLNVGSIELKKA